MSIRQFRRKSLADKIDKLELERLEKIEGKIKEKEVEKKKVKMKKNNK